MIGLALAVALAASTRLKRKSPITSTLSSAIPTEYNNSLFIQKLCQKLGTDKKDLFVFFLDLKNNYDDNQVSSLLENYEINKLDINT